MKIGKLRFSTEDDLYLLPEEKLEEFEEVLDRVERAEWYSDGWYDVCGEFDDKFDKYKVEGDLCNLKIIMEE